MKKVNRKFYNKLFFSFKEVSTILRQTAQALGHEKNEQVNEWRMNEQNNERVE